MNRNDQEFLVQKIRTQYTEKEHSRLDKLIKMSNLFEISLDELVFSKEREYIHGSRVLYL